MHPYEMQRLLRERHKDDILVLKRGSLYHAVNRLLRADLIEAVATGRTGGRPERTTYRLLPAGQQQLRRWLMQMLAVPRHEPSEFMGAVSFLVYLSPDEAITQLAARAARLEEEILALGATIKGAVARVTRINLLESEYLLALRRAELTWVRGVLADVRSRRLRWDLEAILGRTVRARTARAPREKESA